MSVAAYLKENPILHEIVCMMRENYKNYGRLHGKCSIENPSDELRFLVGRILADMMSKSYQDKGPLTFRFLIFFDRLNKIVGAREDIEGMLMEYFGAPTVTRPAVALRQKDDFELFLKDILMSCSIDMEWRIRREIVGKGRIYAFLKNAFKEDTNRAPLLWAVIRTMWIWVIGQIHVPAENLKLVMISDLLTKDPHGLDKTSSYRRIFIYLLSIESGKCMPEASSEKEQEFLGIFNIYTDLVSSFISVYNIREESLGNKSISLWGPFADMGQPMNITLANLLEVKKVITPGKILIVENPSVFESLCPHINKKNFGLVCSHGNLNMALLKLLETAIKTNPDIRLYYNGDFDLGGITIANSMLNRFEKHLTLVHYDKATYDGISSAVIVPELKLLAKLGKVHPFLVEITEAVAKRGVACYQESIVDELIGFVS